MKKIVIIIMILFLLFVLINVYTEDVKETRFEIHPTLFEFADESNQVSVAFGLLDLSGDKTQVWNVFPMYISVQSGKSKISLALNGLSFLTRAGIHFGDILEIKGVHKDDVVSVGGDVSIYGKVEGDVWVLGANVYLMPNSVVTGNVVSLGGNIDSAKTSVIQGAKWSIPDVQIPFLNLLLSPLSAEIFLLIIQLLSIFLFLLILFIYSFFGKKHLTDLSNAITYYWKGSILYFALSIIILPLLIVLLVTSAIGILFIPILLLFIIAASYMGFSALTVRIGRKILKKETNTSAYIYLAGLVGYLIINAPIILGLIILLLFSDLMVLYFIGSGLKWVGSIIIYLAFLFGLGASLAAIRVKAKGE